jgi:hypothetical protein
MGEKCRFTLRNLGDSTIGIEYLIQIIADITRKRRGEEKPAFTALCSKRFLSSGPPATDPRKHHLALT